MRWVCVLWFVGLSQASADRLFCLSFGTATQEWCESNCNNDPAFCPPEFCFCSADPDPVKPPQTELSCVASAPATNIWCNEVCNFDPPFCPANLCRCSDVVQPPVASCISIRQPATDSWCDANCNAGDCPSEYCQCGARAVFVSRCPEVTDAYCTEACQGLSFSCPTDCCEEITNSHISICTNLTDVACSTLCTSESTECPASCCIPRTTLAPYNETGCCEDRTTLFSVNGSDVLRANVRAGAITSVQTCAKFKHPSDIKVDAEGGVFVADSGAGVIAYIAPDCGNVTLVTSWDRDQLVANPVAIVVTGGRLLVADAGKNIVWALTLSASKVVLLAEDTQITDHFVSDMAISADLSELYLVVDHRSIYSHVFATGNTRLFFQSAAIADISSLVVSNFCGVFFSAAANNQVWRCQNNECSQLCFLSGTDSTSCGHLTAPSGLAADCTCNLYVSNAGSGQLVRFQNLGDFSDNTSPFGEVLASAPEFAGPIEVFTAQNNCLLFTVTLVIGGLTLAQVTDIQDAIFDNISSELQVEVIKLVRIELVQDGIGVTFKLRAPSTSPINNVDFLKRLTTNLAQAAEDDVTFVSFLGGAIFLTPPRTITCGQTVQGNLFFRPNKFLVPSNGAAADISYTMELFDSETRVELSTCNQANFPTLIAIYQNQNFVAFDTHQHRGCTGSTSRSVLHLPRGTFTVVLEGVNGAKGNFNLSASCLPPTICPDLVNSVTNLDSTQAETIIQGGGFFPGPDETQDVFCDCFVLNDKQLNLALPQVDLDRLLITVTDSVPCGACIVPMIFRSYAPRGIDSHFDLKCPPSLRFCDQLLDIHDGLDPSAASEFENGVLGAELCFCLLSRKSDLSNKQLLASCANVLHPTCPVMVEWVTELFSQILPYGSQKHTPTYIDVFGTALCSCFSVSNDPSDDFLQCNECIQPENPFSRNGNFLLDPSCTLSQTFCSQLDETYTTLTAGGLSSQRTAFEQGFLGRLYCTCPGVTESFCVPPPIPPPSISCGTITVGNNVNKPNLLDLDGLIQTNVNGVQTNLSTSGDDLYELVVTRTTIIRLSTCNHANFDTVIAIFDQRGALQTINNNDAFDFCLLGSSQLLTTLDPGTYIVLATGTEAEGSYSLAADCLDESNVITCGQQFSGVFSNSRPDTMLRLVIPELQRVTLSTCGGTRFDTIILVTNGRNNFGSDDDGCGVRGGASLFTRVFAPGNYTTFVGGFHGNLGDPGDYILTVTCTPATAPPDFV